MKEKVGYFSRRDVEISVSTARSVSVTRSTAIWTVREEEAVLYYTPTVLFGARGLRCGTRRDDAFSSLFGNGDHEVVDLLEVDVRHVGNN
jgi:hypothetical protein